MADPRAKADNRDDENFLTVSDLFIRYPWQGRKGGLEVIGGLDLEVRRGEFLAIIGPSGCGKSSLLRAIGGLQDTTAGSIRVAGMTPDEARRNRLFGMVFQNPVIFEWRTVLKNICLPGEIFRQALPDEKARELAKLVGLEGFEHAYPRELSGGMKSRVAIARSLSYNPELLLMDEPFGSLDEITRERMNYVLLKIWQIQRFTVLFVTHNIMEAVFLADRVAVMGMRPSNIKQIVNIDLPRPRTIECMGEKKFQTYLATLRSAIDCGGAAYE
ncbi:MAG: ABC transporter ATP-binding protein [Desulfatibacillaceae bacterium]|nr:ABC transporter ATP-binding protein [Desulfatibacillaceae bacterium]